MLLTQWCSWLCSVRRGWRAIVTAPALSEIAAPLHAAPRAVTESDEGTWTCSSTDGLQLQVNLQLAEVYVQGCAMLPLPLEVASNPDVRAVLGSSDSFKNAVATLLSSTTSCREFSLTGAIADESPARAYHLSAWVPLDRTSLRAALAPSLEGVIDSVPSVLPWPRRIGKALLRYLGQDYVPYCAGSCGWLSKMLDPLLASARAGSESGDDAGPPEVLEVWKDHATLGDDGEDKMEDSAGTELRLLYFVQQQGLWRLYELRAEQTTQTLLAFAVFEEARTLRRAAVFASDTRHSLAALLRTTASRARHEGMQHRGGHLLGWPAACGHRAVAVTVQRLREDGESREIYVPHHHLCGLLPGCLLDAHAFWRSGTLIRGTCYDKNVENSLLIQLDAMADTVSARLQRHHVSGRIDTLIDPGSTPTGGVVRWAVAMLGQIESRSHMLVWALGDLKVNRAACCAAACGACIVIS